MNEKREFLRHTIATLAYRCSKTLRDAPADFATFKTEQTANTPVFLLSHISDLLEWAFSMARGEPKFPSTVITDWSLEKQRFYLALKTLDEYLATDQPVVKWNDSAPPMPLSKQVIPTILPNSKLEL